MKRLMKAAKNAYYRGWKSRIRKKAVLVEDMPDRLDFDSVYLVGENGDPWFTAMLCPCGCGDALQMSLLPDDVPSWKFELHRDGTVSLFPSINRIRNCRSHFFLRHGRVEFWRGK